MPASFKLLLSMGKLKKFLVRRLLINLTVYFTEYQEAEGWVGSSSSSSVGGSRSGTPTPRNSPKPTSHDSPHSVDDDNMPPSSTSTLRSPLDLRDTLDHSLDHSLSPSARSTLTRPEIAHVMNSLKRETFSRCV